jgi:GDPmannose 4,6-dehydratase
VQTLLGDASKAHQKLGWRAETDFAGLVSQMVAEDLEQAKRDALVAKQGYRILSRHE